MGNRPVIDLGEQGGPSRSYIYRMRNGTANPSLEEIEAVLKAYGSSLGEFFEPWKENERMERQKLAAEARIRLNRIIDSDVDITGLVEFLKILDPGE